MSKIKRSLPEDIDVTDPRDTGNYGEPDVFVDAERAVSYSLWEITKAIAVLEKYPKEAYESRKELIAHATALTKLSEKDNG